MAVSAFEQRFKGGHPNSLGNTVAIVDEVLADKSALPELFDTWRSDDELVRLRLANAVRRICVVNPGWIAPYLDDLTGWVANIDQPSTQWTLAKLFQMLEPHMNSKQKMRSLEIMKRNVAHHNDWIVLNNTMETLTEWAIKDTELGLWLTPHLERHAKDKRKSVKARAEKFLKTLSRNAPRN